MKLNFLLRGHGPTVVLLHGLFGSLDNLGTLAKALQHDHQTIQVDLRNHGLSPHSPEMNYALMAADIASLLNTLSVSHVTLIGHSMGGKVAMKLTEFLREKIQRCVVIDIAPIAYTEHQHDAIFAAMNAVSAAHVNERRDAAVILQQQGIAPAIAAFLLKSFSAGKWRFNLPALQQHYEDILDWQPVPQWNKPMLFIRGEHSNYLLPDYRDAIAQQFPQARAHTVAGCGHWVHAEKPLSVISIVQRFLAATA